MKDEAYRRRFRKDYEAKCTPRVWQRDFGQACIVACPDASIVGKSFGQVADERGVHPVDAFLDLVVEHGKKLRWHTLIANHRPREISADDARAGGAHRLRRLGRAHPQHGVLQLPAPHAARRCATRSAQGRPVMPIEKAVWRLTGEIADWLDVDAGHLRVGRPRGPRR